MESQSGPSLFSPSIYIWCYDQPLELIGELLHIEKELGRSFNGEECDWFDQYKCKIAQLAEHLRFRRPGLESLTCLSLFLSSL